MCCFIALDSIFPIVIQLIFTGVYGVQLTFLLCHFAISKLSKYIVDVNIFLIIFRYLE